jgi:hypothetical protein
MGQKRNSYRVFVGKPEEKRPVGRPKHRSEDSEKSETDHKKLR